MGPMINILRVAFAVLMCVYFSHNSVGQPTKVRYGQAFSALTSIYSLPVFIAYRQGFFTREGLDFGQILIPGGGDKMIAALHDGSVDITHVATPYLIRSALAGSDAVAIAAEFDNPIYSLVVKPEIRTFGDLRGKLVGLADEGGTIAISMRKLLVQNGLGEGDFRVKVISGTPARFSCLERGACDAVPLGQPQDLVAESQGFRLLGFSNQAVPNYLYTVTAARRSWADAHKEILISYIHGLASAFKFIRDPTNRPEVVKAIVDATGFSDESAEKTLILYFEPERHVLPQRGEIDLRGLDEVIAIMGAAGILNNPLPASEEFVDRQYLHAAGIQ